MEYYGFSYGGIIRIRFKGSNTVKRFSSQQKHPVKLLFLGTFTPNSVNTDIVSPYLGVVKKNFEHIYDILYIYS